MCVVHDETTCERISSTESNRVWFLNLLNKFEQSEEEEKIRKKNQMKKDKKTVNLKVKGSTVRQRRN